MKLVVFARIWFEGNSFCPRGTTLADFTAREWVVNAASAAPFRNTATELGAALAWIEQHRQQVEVTWALCCAAPPGGPLVEGLFDDLVRQILDRVGQSLREGPLDGLYLSLHGAMQAVGVINPELVLLQRLRAVVGPALPIAVSFDLHANLDPCLTQYAQIVVGYKTYPHIDMAATATRALNLLLATMAGAIRPVSAVLPVKKILPSHRMGTVSGPMAEIEALAEALCRQHGLLDVTPFGGFAYADSPQTGASVSACVDSSFLPSHEWIAINAAQQVVNVMQQRSAEFVPSLPDTRSGLDRALSLAQQRLGCVALLDPADNPLSGGGADTTELFRLLLDTKLTVPTVFAFFHDPHIVRRAIQLNVGGEFTVKLGGRLTSKFGAPVVFHARVTRITAGRFVNDGPMEAGLACDIGATVVLTSIANPLLRVVVASQCQSPNDMAWCRLHDIDLDHVALFCVKAKNHFRAAFTDHVRVIIDIDAPGPAMLDLGALPYQFVEQRFLPPTGRDVPQH